METIKFPPKKPKKPKVTDGEGPPVVEAGEPWPDYTYEDLLARAFAALLRDRPEAVREERRKLLIPPPQLLRVHGRKTALVNFLEIARLLQRQPKHLMSYILAELSTEGSVDAGNRLIIKDCLKQDQLETVLRKFVREYVTCHSCRSPETSFNRDNRLYFLQCHSCGSRCSVEVIKPGYTAQLKRRGNLGAQ